MRLIPISNNPPQLSAIKTEGFVPALTTTSVPFILNSMTAPDNSPLTIYLAIGVTLFFVIVGIFLLRCCFVRRQKIREAYGVLQRGMEAELGERFVPEPTYDAPRDLVTLTEYSDLPPSPPSLPPSSNVLRRPPLSYRGYSVTMSRENESVRASLESQLSSIYGNRSK